MIEIPNPKYLPKTSVPSVKYKYKLYAKNPTIATISIVFIGTAVSFIPIEFFKLINPYLFTGYINIFLKAFYDPIPWHEINQMIIVCGLWSMLFISLSFLIFNNKDITE